MNEPAETIRKVEIVRLRGGAYAAVERGAASPASRALAPLSWIYGCALAFARRGRLRRSVAVAQPATVISIGNIEAGGTGKTPFSMFLIEKLNGAGCAPVYLSRGYAGAAGRLDAVTIVLPEETRCCPPVMPGVRYVARTNPGLYREIGDEGAVVAGRLPRIPLFFSKRKRAALEIACGYFSPSHVILDDAFQSWSIPRDIDIVLLDPMRPFGRGGLLPAGLLREKPSALERADAVGLIGEAAPEDVERTRIMIRRAIGADRPVFTARRTISFIAPDGRSVAAPRGPVASLSSIARPDGFDSMLLGAGCELVCSIRYPDHHRYTPGDAVEIRTLLTSKAISSFVTTEKDWVKLGECDFGSVMPLRAVLDLDSCETDILSMIEAIMRKPRPGAAVS